MEAMMKDICEGRRTKNDVVQESINMYREVFMKANREVNVLVEVDLSPSGTNLRHVSNTYGKGIMRTIEIQDAL
jgi:hypothetical protein